MGERILSILKKKRTFILIGVVVLVMVVVGAIALSAQNKTEEVSGEMTDMEAEKETMKVAEEINENNSKAEVAASKIDPAYKLVWEDNFDGTELNRDDWNVELHAPGWVNAEWQEYVDCEDNIYVKDGNLIIQPIKDENDYYTSGRVNTQNKHDFKYGRFEARLKVPSGMGFLPAFWMMPTDESFYGQWPKCGEIDIMEVMGQSTDTLHGTLHFGEPHAQRQGTYKLQDGDFSKEFHVFACEWEPGEMRFYVDDELYFTEHDWFTKRNGFDEVTYPAPFDQPFYMILNVAVGGSWVGYPDATTKFEENAQMVVDYVRVYQKDSYDENVSKPVKEVVFKESDETGNYVSNGKFENIESLEDDTDWKFLLFEGGNYFGNHYSSEQFNQQFCMGYVRSGAADRHRYSDDLLNRLFPGLPDQALVQAYPGQPVYQEGHWPYQGKGCHLPVSGFVYRSGGYRGYRQYRRCGGGDLRWRRRRCVLDVDRCLLWHDDKLF